MSIAAADLPQDTLFSTCVIDERSDTVIDEIDGCCCRDLSPSNLLLAESPQRDAPLVLKIADFGLSACCAGNENQDAGKDRDDGAAERSGARPKSVLLCTAFSVLGFHRVEELTEGGKNCRRM